MALEAPVLDARGKSSEGLALDGQVFGEEFRQHLIHETVRAEFAAARSATRGGKSRSDVAGGGAKPWRQKGTGRARQGTVRAVHFEGGGMAFPPNNRSFDIKVNRKTRSKALRSALSAHVSRDSIGVLDSDLFEAPSTKAAAALLDTWGEGRPVLVVCEPGDDAIVKSFRNLAGIEITTPLDLEVRDLVWARSLLLTRDAVDAIVGRAA